MLGEDKKWFKKTCTQKFWKATEKIVKRLDYSQDLVKQTEWVGDIEQRNSYYRSLSLSGKYINVTWSYSKWQNGL